MSTRIELLEPRRLLSGVTLITHGQGGSAGGEVAATADRIAARAGGAAQYVMTVVSDAFAGARVQSFVHDADTPTLDEVPTGEMIIRLDYDAVNTLPTSVPARVVAEYLLANRLLEQQVHLAGPSRGGSLVSNLAIELAKRDLWVDHVTYIDPVPAEAVVPGVVIDGPMRVADNVIFADNYWRSDNNVFNGFDGQHVDGAHEGNLNATVQADNFGDPHVGAGAYYIATIDPSEPIVPPAKESWFQGTAAAPARDETGYAFSRIAGGDRPLDGAHPLFGGPAHRDAVARMGTQWANVYDLSVVGATTLPAGQALTVKFRYGDTDSNPTVSVFLDRDRNPYNGNSVTRFARQSFPARGNAGEWLSGTTVEARPGEYFVYARITDAEGHVRYAYATDSINVTAPTNDLLFVTRSAGEIRVAGTAGNDRIFATTNGFSLLVTRHEFTQPVPLAGAKRIVFDVGSGDDSVVIGAGVSASVIIGASGNDTLIGGDGNDTLAAGSGRDRLFGGAGDDRIEAGGDSDYAEGGVGRDRFYGETGNDVLLGGAHNDVFFGGSGADTINGGAGSDFADPDPLDVLTAVP
jgi:Ca2+-binding RTX toxin-like protein